MPAELVPGTSCWTVAHSVAQNFSLSLKLVRVWKAYRKLPGPQMFPRTKQPVVVLSPQFGAEKREQSKGSPENGRYCLRRVGVSPIEDVGAYRCDRRPVSRPTRAYLSSS